MEIFGPVPVRSFPYQTTKRRSPFAQRHGLMPCRPMACPADTLAHADVLPNRIRCRSVQDQHRWTPQSRHWQPCAVFSQAIRHRSRKYGDCGMEAFLEPNPCLGLHTVYTIVHQCGGGRFKAARLDSRNELPSPGTS